MVLYYVYRQIILLLEIHGHNLDCHIHTIGRLLARLLLVDIIQQPLMVDIFLIQATMVILGRGLILFQLLGKKSQYRHLDKFRVRAFTEVLYIIRVILV